MTFCYNSPGHGALGLYEADQGERQQIIHARLMHDQAEHMQTRKHSILKHSQRLHTRVKTEHCSKQCWSKTATLQPNQPLVQVRRAKSASRCSTRALDLAVSTMMCNCSAIAAIDGRSLGFCCQHCSNSLTTCESSSRNLRPLPKAHRTVQLTPTSMSCFHPSIRT